MHTVIETASYIAGLKKAGVTLDERRGIIDVLALDPTAGDLIKETGVRARFATPKLVAARAAAIE